MLALKLWTYCDAARLAKWGLMVKTTAFGSPVLFRSAHI